MQQMCWLQELCAVLSTKLAQSRETLVAAAPVSASSWCCQLSLSVAVSLFFCCCSRYCAVESEIDGCLDWPAQPHPGALEVWWLRDQRISIAPPHTDGKTHTCQPPVLSDMLPDKRANKLNIKNLFPPFISQKPSKPTHLHGVGVLFLFQKHLGRD